MIPANIHPLWAALVNAIWTFIVVGVVVWIILYFIGLASERVRRNRDRAALIVAGIFALLMFLAALS